jgi:hypothetical protein
MWDALYTLVTVSCFAAAVLYVRACMRLKESRNHA